MIKKILGFGVLLWFFVLSLPAHAIFLTVDGTFSDANSGLVSGTRQVRVSINKNADLLNRNMGTELWYETLSGVTFSSGFMSVELGRTTPIKPEFFTSANLIFVVAIDGIDGSVGVPIRHVPLAVHSQVASVAMRVSGNAIEGPIAPALITGVLSGVTGIGPLNTTLNAPGVVVGSAFVANAGQGRVGVGTSAPTHLLDVAGDMRVRGSVVFPDGSTLNSVSLLSAGAMGSLRSSTDVMLEADTGTSFSGRIVAKIGTVERLVIQNDGRVGIGTTVPLQELEVNGGILVRNTNIANPGTIRFNGQFFEGYDGVSWRRLDIQTHTAGGWGYDALEKVVSQTDPTSRVGIGVASPDAKLHVIGETRSDYFRGAFIGDGAQITAINPLALAAVVPIAKGGTGTSTLNVNRLMYSTGEQVAVLPLMGPGQLVIGTGLAPTVSSLTAGSGVVIANAPGSIVLAHAATSTANTVTLNAGHVIQGIYLDVFGHITELATANLDNRYYTQPQADGRFVTKTGDVLTGSLVFSGVTTSIQSAVGQPLSLVAGSGMVGIGMTAPQQALDVGGALRVGYSTTAVDGTIRFDPDSKRFQGYGADGWVALDNVTNTAGGWVLESDRVTLQNAAHNVGVGTYTPTSRLHVVGSSRFDGPVTVSGNIGVGTVFFGTNSIRDGVVSGNWLFSQGALTDIAQLSAQTLGVGTAVPSAAFHVVGNARVSGDLSVGSLTLGTRSLGAGTLSGNWVFTGAGEGTSLAVDAIGIDTDQISTSAGPLRLSGMSGVYLGNALQVTGHVMSALTDGDIRIVPYQNRSVVLGTVTFNQGTVSGLKGLSVDGAFSVQGILQVATPDQHVGIRRSPLSGTALAINGDVLVGATTAMHDGAIDKSNLYIEGNLVVDGTIVQAQGGANVFSQLEIRGPANLATQFGRVGVGTTVPAAMLEIRATNNLTNQRVFTISNADPALLLTMTNAGALGLAVPTPTAALHLPAGTESRAPLKFTAGTLLFPNEPGAVEFDGTSLYYTTSGGTRNILLNANGAQILNEKTIQNGLLGNNTVSGTWNTVAPLTIGGNTTHPVTVLSKEWRVDTQGNATVASLTAPSINIRNATLVVNATGVGIGTVPQASKLHVIGNTVLGSVLGVFGGQTDKSNLYIEGDLSMRGRIDQPQEAPRSDLSRLQVFGTTQLATVSGNVVIGTPTGTASLEIQATTNTAFARPLRIRVGDTTPIFTVRGDGRVGIGVDIPNSALQVIGTVNASLFVGNASGTTATFAELQSPSLYSTGVLALTAVDAVTVKDRFSFVTLGTGGQLMTPSGDMTLSAAGVVGIESVTFNAGVVTGITGLSMSGAVTINAGTVTLQNTPFSVNNAALYVGPSGGVGIGTTSPSVPLQVIGTINATRFVGDGSGLFNVGSSWTQNPDLTVYYNNNVGIGVTAPQAKLHVGAGTVSTPAIVLSPSVLTVVPISGAFEYDGSNWYVSDGVVRRKMATLEGTQTLSATTLQNPTVNGQLRLDGTLQAPNWSVASNGQGLFSGVNIGSLAIATQSIFLSAPTLNVQAQNALRAMNVWITTDNRVFADTGNLVLGRNTDTIQVSGVTVSGTVLSGITSLAMQNGQISGVSGLFVSGNTILGGPVVVSGGDIRLPATTSVIASANTTLTMSASGTGEIGISAPRTRFNTTGMVIEDSRVGIGALPISNTALYVVGTVNATRFVGDGSGLANLSFDSLWHNVGPTQIRYTSGNVAIGRSDAQALLHLGQSSTTRAAVVLTPGGSLLSVPQEGAIEYVNGLYYTDATARRTVVNTDSPQTLSAKTLASPVITGGMSLTGSLSGEGWLLSSSNATFPKVQVGNTVLLSNRLETATSTITVAPGSGQVLISDYLTISSGNGTLATLRFTTNGQMVSDTGLIAIGPVTVNAGAVSGITSLAMTGGVSGPTSLVMSGPISGATSIAAQAFLAGNQVSVGATGMTSSSPLFVSVSPNQSITLVTSGTGEVRVSSNYFAVDTTLLVADKTTGRVGVGTVPVANARLVVSGTVNATAFVGDGAGLFNLDSVWDQDTVGRLSYTQNGVGIGLTAPLAYLHLAGGTTTTPSLILAPASGLSATLREGALEYMGNTLYLTDSVSRRALVTTDGTQTLSAKTFTAPVLTGTTVVSGLVTANAWRIETDGAARFNSVVAGSLSALVPTLQITATTAVQVQNAFSFSDGTTRRLAVSGGGLDITAEGSVSIAGMSVIGGAMSGASLTLTGNVQATNAILSGVFRHDSGVGQFPLGAQWTVSANQNIGIVQSGSGQFRVTTDAFVVNNTDVVVLSGGRVGIGVMPTQIGLAIVGTVNATRFVGDGSGLTNIPSVWSSAGGNTYYEGQVGVGVTNPGAWLHVVGGSTSTASILMGTASGLRSVPQAGALEFYNNQLYFTDTVRRQVVTDTGIQTLSQKTLSAPTVSGILTGTGWTVSGTGTGTFAGLAVGNTQLTTTGLLYAGGSDLLVSADGKVLVDTAFQFDGTARTLQISGGDAMIESLSGGVRIESVTINAGAISGVSTLSLSGDLTLGNDILALDDMAVMLPINKNLSVVGSGTGMVGITANRFAVNTSAFTVTSTGVGIGTTAPNTALQVVGTLNATHLIGDGSGITGLDFIWQDNGAGGIYVNPSRVGIGTTQPIVPLHVASSNGVLFALSGAFDAGGGSQAIPTSGAGVYTMWYPGKAAFRAGRLSTDRATYWDNAEIGLYSVAFGLDARARGLASVVSGGERNQVIGAHSIIGGGFNNFINNFAYNSILGGAENNVLSGTYVTVGGGQSNTVQASHAVLGGGFGHVLSGDYGVVVGGNQNRVTGQQSFAGGGGANRVDGTHAVVVGGLSNVATGNYTFVGGGQLNDARTQHSVVVGGYGNVAGSVSNAYASVLGGYTNAASGAYSSVGGGYENSASGAYATVPGGYQNSASGSHSMAIGQRAKAQHTGAYVWADSESNDFASTGADQYLIRAAGGVGIGTATPLAQLHISRSTPGNVFVGTSSSGRQIVMTTDGDLGIGTLVPSTNLHVLGSLGRILVAADVANSGTSEIQLSETRAYTDGMLLRYDGTTDRMQIWGQSGGNTYGPHMNIQKITGNVSIGTTDAIEKMTINGGIAVGELGSPPAAATGYGKLYYYDGNMYVRVANGAITNLTSGASALWQPLGNDAYYHNPTSGQLAIGTSNIVTWQTYNTIQLGNTAALAFDAKTSTDEYHSVNNAYYNSGAWRYKRTGFATRYSQTQGTQAFYTASSGAAATVITWIPMVFMATNGDIGIGTTTPQNKLDVSGVVRGTQFVSTVANGTAPFSVVSATLVPSLNAQYLGGNAASAFFAVNNGLSELVATATARTSLGLSATDSPSFVRVALTETVLPPFTVASTALVNNLNAERLNGFLATDFVNTGQSVTVNAGVLWAFASPVTMTMAGQLNVVDTGILRIGPSATLAVSGNFNFSGVFQPDAMTVAGTVTANLFVGSGTGLTGLNASSLSSGTVASARVSGNYLGVTGVGTLTSGVWNGTAIGVAYGGTGAANATDARTNLGLVIGTDVQAYDAGLASIAGLTTAADKMIYTTASDTYAVADLTAFGRSVVGSVSGSALRTTLGLGTADSVVFANVFTSGTITANLFVGSGAGLTTLNASSLSIGTVASARVSGNYSDITGVGTLTNGVWNGTAIGVAYGGTGAANATDARTNLGLVIGTDVQAYDAGLASIAGLTTAADQMIYTTASDAYAVTALRAPSRVLLAATNSADMKAILVGVGLPSTDTTYTAGAGLQLNSTVFSVDSTVVTSNYAGTVTANLFVGSGAGLTALNASSLATGTVPSARVSGAYTGITGLGTLTDLQIDNLNLNGNTLSTTSGALAITPLAGQNLNITLGTTGDLAVNTNQLYVDTSASRVGILTATPSTPLHVTGFGDPGVNEMGFTLDAQLGGYKTGIYFNDVSGANRDGYIQYDPLGTIRIKASTIDDGSYEFYGASSANITLITGNTNNRIVLVREGTFTVGMSAGLTPDLLLTGGNVIVGNTGTVRIAGATASTGTNLIIDVNGDIRPETSSARFKTNISPVSMTTKRVLDMVPIQFDYKPVSGNPGTHVPIGVIAEQVAEVFPEAVNFDAEGKAYSINQSVVVYAMLDVMRDMNKKIETQSQQIQLLLERVKTLEERLNQ